MCRPTASGLLLLLAGCGAHITGNADHETADAAVEPDSGVIGVVPPPADAAPDAVSLGAWSAPAVVTVAATAADEDDGTLSSNALEMIFAVGTLQKDLYYTSRTAIGAAWAPIAKLPFDTAASEETPRFSGDDKTLYFASDRISGNLDIYVVTRTTVGSNTTWGQPSKLALSTGAAEKWLAPCAGDRYVVVQTRTDTGADLLEGTLSGGAPTPIDALNSPDNETGAFLTQDCLTIYFASNRTVRTQLYVSHRTAIGQPWQPPAPVTDFKIGNGTDNQEDPWLSPDGRTFALASDASGSKDVYLSTR